MPLHNNKSLGLRTNASRNRKYQILGHIPFSRHHSTCYCLKRLGTGSRSYVVSQPVRCFAIRNRIICYGDVLKAAYGALRGPGVLKSWVRWQLWSLGTMRSRAHENRELAHPCYRQSQVLTSSTRKGTTEINIWARCARATKSVHSPVTLRLLHRLRGFSKLYGVTPLGIICYGCGSGWPGNITVIWRSVTLLWPGSAAAFYGGNPAVTSSQTAVTLHGKGKNQAPLTDIFRKFHCYWEVWFLFHTSFPDEVGWGWIYTIRLFSPRLSGSLNWEFHFSVEAYQSAPGPRSWWWQWG